MQPLDYYRKRLKRATAKLNSYMPGTREHRKAKHNIKHIEQRIAALLNSPAGREYERAWSERNKKQTDESPWRSLDADLTITEEEARRLLQIKRSLQPARCAMRPRLFPEYKL